MCHKGKTTYVFDEGKSYDWYVLEKIPCYKNTIIKDTNEEVSELNLLQWAFLPNSNFSKIEPLLKGKDEEGCQIIYSASAYETRKKWVSYIQDSEFKYPLIHSTPKSGVRYMYSSRNDRGIFGVPKIIFGVGGIYNCVIDIQGEYGMTQNVMAIPISSVEEGRYIKRVIESETFRKIIESCTWSGYLIEWSLFTYFKHDFYKYITDPSYGKKYKSKTKRTIRK